MTTTSYMTIKLAGGKHADPSAGGCVMEVTSLLAREPFSDRPRCVARDIADFLRCFNDWLDDDERHVLWPFTTRVIGTINDDAKRRRERRFRFADWACREIEPLTEVPRMAKRLRALPPIADSASTITPFRILRGGAARLAVCAAPRAPVATARYAFATAMDAADNYNVSREEVIARCVALLDELLPSETDVGGLDWESLEAVGQGCRLAAVA